VRNLKAFKLLPILFLLLGIFANIAMAESCFCGEACPHDFPINGKKTVSFPLHNHCVGSHCKSCNFEDGQLLKAKNLSNKAPNFTGFDTPIVIFTVTTHHVNNHLDDGVDSWIYTGEKIPFTPIHLQNRCLLC